MDKIHILGGPGSGKSYLGKQLSNIYGIKLYSLDDIFWDNGNNKYGIITNEIIRNDKLKSLLKNNKWIIEGTYFEWVKESFERADIIIVLNTHFMIRCYRIIKRFILNKFHPTGRKENIGNLLRMLYWNYEYEHKIHKSALLATDSFNAKRIILKNIKL